MAAADAAGDARADVARARAAVAGLRQPAGMYHPHRMRAWDATMLAALAFTALVTPFELGFLEGARAWADVDALFGVNRLVDLLFARDILVNFRLGFFDARKVLLLLLPLLLRILPLLTTTTNHNTDHAHG